MRETNAETDCLTSSAKQIRESGKSGKARLSL